MPNLRNTFIALLLSVFTNPAIAADEPANPPLVRVNGVEITLKQLEFFLSKQKKQMSPQQGLAEMISVELLVQEARNNDMLKNLQLNQEIRHSTSNLIATHYLTDFLKDLKIPEADLRARYESQYLKENAALEYNADHILVESEQLARDLIGQLQSGVDFGALAQQHSTGPSGQNGGALGWFKKPDMVKPFAEAAAALQPGGITNDPVQTQFGWHVIRLNQTREQKPPEFEAVRSELNTTIVAEKIRARMQSLHQDASIEYLLAKPEETQD